MSGVKGTIIRPLNPVLQQTTMDELVLGLADAYSSRPIPVIPSFSGYTLTSSRVGHQRYLTLDTLCWHNSENAPWLLQRQADPCAFHLISANASTPMREIAGIRSSIGQSPLKIQPRLPQRSPAISSNHDCGLPEREFQITDAMIMIDIPELKIETSPQITFIYCLCSVACRPTSTTRHNDQRPLHRLFPTDDG